MKKQLIKGLTAILLLASMSACGVGHAYVVNHNQNNTQVHLSSNNFRVVNKVSGSSEVSYVLIFGGRHKKQLYSNAYAAMIEKAELESGSKALVNLVTEEHVGGVPPFFTKRTITVSAHVIEFTD